MFEKLQIQTFQAAHAMSRQFNAFHFTSHLRSVMLSTKILGESLGLKDQEIISLQNAVILYDSVMTGLPLEFAYYDPNETDVVQKNQSFFGIYLKSVKELGKLKSFKNYVIIFLQIFENDDGTGKPNELKGQRISKAAQMIKICAWYHNYVYKLSTWDMEVVRKGAEVVQSRQVTFDKHNEAVKLLYKRANRFEKEIFDSFQDMIRLRKCASLVPHKGELVAPGKYGIFKTGAQEEKETKSKVSNENTEASGSSKFIDKKIEIADLKAGMTVSHNVVTKSGMLVVKQDSELTDDLVRNIQQLQASGMLEDLITIITKRDS
jgi:HD domain-containing protein